MLNIVHKKEHLVLYDNMSRLLKQHTSCLHNAQKYRNLGFIITLENSSIYFIIQELNFNFLITAFVCGSLFALVWFQA